MFASWRLTANPRRLVRNWVSRLSTQTWWTSRANPQGAAACTRHQRATPEPGQARSTQDGAAKQESTRSSGVVSTNSDRKFKVYNIPNEVELQAKCKCNSTNDLTCDQFDFSTTLHTLFMDNSANTPTANVMNTDVPNNVSSKQEFPNHQKLHSNSFKDRLKNKHKNSATAAKTKKQPQSDNKIHPKV